MNFEFVGKHFAQKTHEQMKDVLMNPEAVGPEIYYYMIRGGFDQKNITVWEPGTVDSEFIKSYGHYHIGDIQESYSILFGEGVVLLQKMELDKMGKIIPDKVLEFKAKRVKMGDIVEIPKSFGHVIVNIGETFLVTSDNTDVLFDNKTVSKYTGHTDYESVKTMQGFAYYVANRDNQPTLVKNTKYSEIVSVDFGNLPVETLPLNMV